MLVKIFHGIVELPYLIDLRRIGLPKEQCAESVPILAVQVNIVAVSDHVFHRFPFDLLIQVSWLTRKMQLALLCLARRRQLYL